MKVEKTTSSTPRRQGDARRSLRRPQPVGGLPLHVRTGLAGGLPELLVRVRPFRRRASAPGSSRRHGGEVSRAPLAKIEAFKKRMGWHFQWVSSYGSDFNADFHVSFTKEEMAQGKVNYNYTMQEFPSAEAPGLSVFYKDADGDVFHTYSTYGRGPEPLMGTYTILDMVPKGRDEDQLGFSMEWVRHHDRYGTDEFADADKPYWPETASPASATWAVDRRRRTRERTPMLSDQDSSRRHTRRPT